MLHQSLPFYAVALPYCFSSSSSMSLPASLLPSQEEIESFNEIFSSVDNQELNDKKNQFIEEFLVDELLDLRGMPEPEKKVEENEEDTKEASVIPFEKNEALLLSEISLPEETEATYLEWLSRFVHDCNSSLPPAAPAVTASKATALIPVKSKRSKRRRTAAVLWSLSVPPLLGDISTASSHASFSSSSSSWQNQNLKNGKTKEFAHIMHNHNTVYQRNFQTLHDYKKIYLKYKLPCDPYFASIPKKRGRKPKNHFAGNHGSGERQCTHCGVKKTPQWRAGPGGPKTLCNACGVRFKSGRLLPEYRPACSPTFISKIHSNSHREVLEMRRKKDEQLSTASAPAVRSW